MMNAVHSSRMDEGSYTAGADGGLFHGVLGLSEQPCLGIGTCCPYQFPQICSLFTIHYDY